MDRRDGVMGSTVSERQTLEEIPAGEAITLPGPRAEEAVINDLAASLKEVLACWQFGTNPLEAPDVVQQANHMLRVAAVLFDAPR